MASGSSGKASRLGLADAWGKLRSLRFNQDQTCFVGALDDGLRVFCLDPIREMSHLRHELVGSVSKAEMLYKTNLIAFVGGGKKPRFPDNAVIVYDDRQQEFVLELSLPETVLSVRLKRDKLIAVCRSDMCIPCCIIPPTGHLSAIRKWGGKTSDYAKSGGARTENSWQV